MKICTHCGLEVPDKTKNCPKCKGESFRPKANNVFVGQQTPVSNYKNEILLQNTEVHAIGTKKSVDKYLLKILNPGEKVIRRITRSIGFYIILLFILGIALMVTGIVLPLFTKQIPVFQDLTNEQVALWILVPFMATGGGVILINLFTLISYLNTEFVLTNQRLIKISGVFSKGVVFTTLDSCEQVNYRRGGDSYSSYIKIKNRTGTFMKIYHVKDASNVIRLVTTYIDYAKRIYR